MRNKIVMAAALMLSGTATNAAAKEAPLVLEGTWLMDAAYEILADGKRVTNYGEHPAGLLMVDADGRYTMQIFRIGRRSFAAGVKSAGTPDEFREAVVGSSTHFGRVSIDPAKRQLRFDVQASSYPNWEGKAQVRDYTFKDGLLSYAVPASASGNGTIAYSIWRKAGSR